MADRQVVTYAELFSSGQIKLAELSVYNWGSFHGLHRARIDPDGTLLTGDNGAGKSTLIDGLMALLLPPGRATFNVAAAQGNRHDRSLISYIRGSNSLAHDGAQTRTKSKREGARRHGPTGALSSRRWIADDLGRPVLDDLSLACPSGSETALSMVFCT